jgi:hypothetical protein
MRCSVCAVIHSVVLPGCLPIGGGVLVQWVLWSDPFRCGGPYVFNIIVISGHCDVCFMYVCVCGFCCCTYVGGGVFSFLVSRGVSNYVVARL